jgi:very-short-patch-repair endonuclease
MSADSYSNIKNKLMRKKVTANTYELRQKALLSRTKAELWAESVIKERFKIEEFEVEYVFKWRRFDFYFKRVHVALEIDGGYHNTVLQRRTDSENDQILYKHFKIKVFRVRNFDLLALHLKLNQIELMLNGKPIIDRKKAQKIIQKRKARCQPFKELHKQLPFKPRVILRKKGETE